jgi:hypothetical protein
MTKVGRNMALAETPEQRRVTAEVFEDLNRQVVQLQAEIAVEPRQPLEKHQVAREVDAALSLLDRLGELAGNDTNLVAISELFQILNARLFLRFAPIKLKKRKVNRVSTGVVTFGDAEAPIKIYEGPTGRRAFQGNVAAAFAAGPGGRSLPDADHGGREGKSSGNVSRGERIFTQPKIEITALDWTRAAV